MITPDDVQFAATLLQQQPVVQSLEIPEGEGAFADSAWVAGDGIGHGAGAGGGGDDDLDLEMTRISVRRHPTRLWHLVLPDGARLPIRARVLIGRAAIVDPRWPDAEVLAIDDPTKSMSKTHACLEVDALGLSVTDLYSLNGTVVTSQDGAIVDLQDGQRARVEAGCLIEFGDFLVRVERQ